MAKGRERAFHNDQLLFCRGAELCQNIDPKVVLIDGTQLAAFMIDFNVGVDSVASYEVKRLVSDYFEED